MKKELDEDAHMNWEEFMDWICKQKDIDTPESDDKSGKNNGEEDQQSMGDNVELYGENTEKSDSDESEESDRDGYLIGSDGEKITIGNDKDEKDDHQQEPRINEGEIVPTETDDKHGHDDQDESVTVEESVEEGKEDELEKNEGKPKNSSRKKIAAEQEGGEIVPTEPDDKHGHDDQDESVTVEESVEEGKEDELEKNEGKPKNSSSKKREAEQEGKDSKKKRQKK